jgi:YhcH/YjgK/YiaL family protein
MMLGDIAHWQEEKKLYPQAVQRGIEYIRSTDFTNLPDGKYEIEGGLLFALLQSPTTRAAELQRPESHRVHTDIQFLLEGRERIGVARAGERQRITDDQFAEKDVAFYDVVESESELLLQPGMFAVFFPADIHRPNCSVDGAGDGIRKVVVKIHSSLL